MKFDLKNVPAVVGTLKKLIWTVEGANGNRSMELAFSQNEGEKVTFSSSKRTLTAYLVFDPGYMTVKPGGKFIVMLEGDKGYFAERVVANGKTYENGKRYTAMIDGNSNTTMSWKPAVVVTTTTPISGGNYNGLKMQIGTWKRDASDEQITLGEATINDGKAVLPVNLSEHDGKSVWVCIPKVTKFFHTLSGMESTRNALTLPDKDKGSTLYGPTADGKMYMNDWIVALYMGVNKGGATGADATPIYWATGNLIATKTNAAGSATDAAFHIATDEETVAEASTSDYIVPTGIAESNSDGYTACAVGTQWNMFGWGDITGLKTSKTASDYAPTGGASISGNANYDIARAKLGGSWRLPTGSQNTANEIAAFADNSFSGLSPDSEDWTESSTGHTYTYPAPNGITNTLKFPAAGYRIGTTSKFLGSQGGYWSGNPFSSSSTAANSLTIENADVYFSESSRHFGFSVRPVTE